MIIKLTRVIQCLSRDHLRHHIYVSLEKSGAIAIIIKIARHSFSARKMSHGYPEYAETFGAL